MITSFILSILSFLWSTLSVLTSVAMVLGFAVSMAMYGLMLAHLYSIKLPFQVKPFLLNALISSNAITKAQCIRYGAVSEADANIGYAVIRILTLFGGVICLPGAYVLRNQNKYVNNWLTQATLSVLLYVLTSMIGGVFLREALTVVGVHAELKICGQALYLATMFQFFLQALVMAKNNESDPLGSEVSKVY